MNDQTSRKAMEILEREGFVADEVASWPTLRPAAFHGVIGEIVRTLEPHTEADPAALLVTALSASGIAIGAGPHAVAEASKHPARLNGVVIGRTAHGRKGASFSQVRRVLEGAEPDFVGSHIVSGLSSGEGLISAVRDGKGEDDVGVLDKRLLVVEEEFSRVMKMIQREGNILSPTIRSAWDRADISTLTRNDPLKATGTHIGIIGHTTLTELRRTLLEVEVANGFANRFLFCLADRSKKLPDGGRLAADDLDRLSHALKRAIRTAKRFGLVQRSPEANERWAQIYEDIDDERDGLVGAVTARAEAQMLRLSVLYAILDGTEVVEIPHLEAAKAVWDYCDASVEYTWGGSLGDDVADRLLIALKDASSKGLDYSAQSALFSRHVSAHRLGVARGLLQGRGLIVEESVETRGKPRTITRYAGAKEAKEAKEVGSSGLTSPNSLSSQEEPSYRSNGRGNEVRAEEVTSSEELERLELHAQAAQVRAWNAPRPSVSLDEIPLAKSSPHLRSERGTGGGS